MSTILQVPKYSHKIAVSDVKPISVLPFDYSFYDRSISQNQYIIVDVDLVYQRFTIHTLTKHTLLTAGEFVQYNIPSLPNIALSNLVTSSAYDYAFVKDRFLSLFGSDWIQKTQSVDSGVLYDHYQYSDGGLLKYNQGSLIDAVVLNFNRAGIIVPYVYTTQFITFAEVGAKFLFDMRNDFIPLLVAKKFDFDAGTGATDLNFRQNGYSGNIVFGWSNNPQLFNIDYDSYRERPGLYLPKDEAYVLIYLECNF